MTEREDAVRAAWSAEAKRRLEEIRTGVVKPVPWEEAEARIFGLSEDPKDH